MTTPVLESSAATLRAGRATIHASIIAGLGVVAIGAFVVCGWTWNVESFKTIYGPITMKTNTAIGLLLCGLALALLHWSPRLSSVVSLAAVLIGAATLLEIVIGWDFGIDQFFFSEAPGAAATASPNRMGPNGAASLVLAGLCLFQLARDDARRATSAQRLAAVALLLPSVAIAGYLYGARQLYGIAEYTGIALHTALAFSVLNVGILLARADRGPVALFLEDGPAATLLRRLAVPIITIPLVLGYFEIAARNRELVDRGLGMALFAVSLVVVLGITLWHTAQVIQHSDVARREAERERDVLIVRERDARAEAERASRLKDQFLATLSHELRTPLNVVLGWTQILERGTSPDKHVHIAGLVAKNGRLLARLVEDLLDLSRITAGQLQITRAPTMLNALVESALEALGPTATAKGVEVSAGLDRSMQPIDADAERLQQIVWNLLSNAVKFTGSSGRIIVQTLESPAHATLIVADNGIGFDDAFASDVFKPFRQADSSLRREHGGLGLGLSIARHIAELHGGSLTGTSAGLGHGATFTLELPRSVLADVEQAVTDENRTARSDERDASVAGQEEAANSVQRSSRR